MRIKVFTAAVLLTLSACVLPAAAQQTESNDQKIRRLRGAIETREKLVPPDTFREESNRRLMELRVELRSVLKDEADRLRDHKAKLTDISPAESQRIDDLIRSFELEIRSLDAALQGGVTAGTGPRAQPETRDPESEESSGAERAAGRSEEEESPAASQPAAGTAPPSAAPTPRTGPPTATTTPTAAASSSAVPASASPLNCDQVSTLSGTNPKTVSEVDSRICALKNSVVSNKARGRRPIVLNSADISHLFVLLLAKRDTPAFLVEAEESRVDKQVGGAPSNSGTTSLVVKGGTPAILGFAVENGALTRSVTGTTVTFRGNPLGIVRTVKNQGLFEGVLEDEKDPVTRFLRKVSFGFSFDTDRGAEPGVFTGTAQQLSAISARVEFINNRRPSRYMAEWEGFLRDRALPLNAAFRQLFSAFVNTSVSVNPPFRDPAMQAWYVATQQALAAAPADQVEAVLRDRIDKLPIEELLPETDVQINNFADQFGLYIAGRDELLDRIAKGTLVTFEYLNKREANAPDTSTFTFIAEKGTSGRVDLTFNGTLTMFNTKPVPADPSSPAGGRIRDFQFAGQIDVPFGSVREAGQFLFWFGGRYERLLEDASTQVGTTLPDTKGDIAVGQFGLKIPIKGLGMHFPISVSFANRTELIKEKEVRGNFGFTFDLDTIFARFKPF
jgi:hypothetical protein